MSWLGSSLGYVVVAGLIGVTTKQALRSLCWPELFLWAAAAYVLAGVVVLATGLARIEPVMPGTALALVTGGLAALGLLVRFAALHRGEVGQVIPVTAAYPLVSVALAAVLLSEPVGPYRIAGTAMVVSGIAILGRA